MNKKKKLTLIEIDFSKQKKPQPPEIKGYYNTKTKQFEYPNYPYGLNEEWK